MGMFQVARPSLHIVSRIHALCPSISETLNEGADASYSLFSTVPGLVPPLTVNRRKITGYESELIKRATPGPSHRHRSSTLIDCLSFFTVV
jgi:hypothetical protein